MAELRIGRFSRLVDARAMGVLAVLAALGGLVFLGGVALGSTSIPVSDLLAVLLGRGEPTDNLIVTQFRLPRALQAIEAGICLAVAGFLVQRATRNAFASPAILGVVDGAGLGVIVFLVAFSDDRGALTVSIAWQPLAALAGGCVAILLLFALAGRQAGAPIRLLLFGIALAAIAKAAIMLLIVTGPVHRASQALRWLAGSVESASWDEVATMAAAMAPLLIAVAFLARQLSVLDLDPATAQALGVRQGPGRAVPVLLAAALTSAAVAMVGGIGFVGLIAPHLARRLVGTAPGAGLAAAGVLGAIMVLGADLLVRALFAPIEVPTGAVTALVGAPYFIFLLARRSPSVG